MPEALSLDSAGFLYLCVESLEASQQHLCVLCQNNAVCDPRRGLRSPAFGKYYSYHPIGVVEDWSVLTFISTTLYEYQPYGFNIIQRRGVGGRIFDLFGLSRVPYISPKMLLGTKNCLIPSIHIHCFLR